MFKVRMLKVKISMVKMAKIKISKVKMSSPYVLQNVEITGHVIKKIKLPTVQNFPFYKILPSEPTDIDDQ